MTALMGPVASPGCRIVLAPSLDAEEEIEVSSATGSSTGPVVLPGCRTVSCPSRKSPILAGDDFDRVMRAQWNTHSRAMKADVARSCR